MALSHGPGIVTNGLVLNLDASDLNSYDRYENLLRYSEDFSNAVWTKSNATVSTEVINGPAGLKNYNKLTLGTFTSNSGSIRGDVGTPSINSVYTSSVYVKQGTCRYVWITFQALNTVAYGAYFDLQTGSFYANHGATSYSSVNVGDGWYRIQIQTNSLTGGGGNVYLFIVPMTISNPTINPSGGREYTGAGEYIYVYGAQMEKNPTATDYYAITSTVKTRGTAWTNLTGRGYDGTLTNGPTYNNGSIVLDGSDDIVTGTIDGSIFTGNFTQSAWIYKLNANTAWQGVFTNSNPATNNTYLMTFGNGSVAAPYNSVGVNQVGAAESGVFLDIGTHINKWLNITIVKSGTILTIYCFKDGTLLQNFGTLSWNSGNFATTNNYVIGIHWTGGFVVNLQGYVETVSLYNRALSLSEVQQNFNALRGRFNV